MSYKYDAATIKNDNMSGICLLVTHKISAIINLFVSTFLVAYIYQFSNGNITDYIFNVGIYELTSYLTLPVLGWLLSYFVEKTNRVWFLRAGVFLRTLLVVFAIFFGEQIASLIWVAGLLNGISMAVYYSAFNVIRHEMVGKKKMGNYVLLDHVLSKVIEVIIPVTLGFLISASTYAQVSIYVFIFCIIQIAFTFGIKIHRPEGSNFSLKEYSEGLNKNPEVKTQLKKVYLIHFFYGFVTLISTALNICIMLQFGSSFSLGIILSVFAIFSIISLLLFKKFTKSSKRGFMYLFCAFAPLVSIICFVIFGTVATLIIYNFCFIISRVIYLYVIESNRFGILKEAGLYDFIAEHHVVAEAVLGLARVICAGLFILVGVLNAFVVFEVFLIASVALVALAPILLIGYEKRYTNIKESKINKD